MLVPKLRFKREDGTDYPEWKEKALQDCTLFIKDGTHGTHKNAKTGYYLLSAKDVYGGIIHKPNDSRLISQDDFNSIYKQYSLSVGDVILTIVGTLGRTAIVTENDVSIAFQRSVAIIRPNKETNSRYLQYVMESNRFQNELETRKSRGAQAGVYLGTLSEIFVPSPHKEEQQKIADFLSTVDEVIAQSEAEVQNLEQQKKAAMQKIFSQEARFKREDGTEYPEWKMDSLKNLCDYTDYRGKTPTKTESGIFLITAKNIKQGYIDYDTSKEYIAESDYDNVMHRGLPQIGDVLITTEAPCGNIAQIDRENVALAQRVIKYRGRKEILSNDYLCFALQSDYFQDELDKKATGGTVKGIKGSVLHTLSIFVPCLEEQRKIADFLSAYDEAISYAKQELEHWKQLKKGLLQQMFV
ncbi:MAG: restriction endonuclease subunit S [Lachnospiraceae bacterium]|nr:restriction endonuclease subunit S [Lachnospiraceae bacterium]